MAESDANEAAKMYREAYIHGLSLDEAYAVGFREGAAHMHKEQAARIERLEKALREWESAVNKLSMRVGLTPQNIADALNPIMDTTRAALEDRT